MRSQLSLEFLDASPSRCGQGRLCSLHRHELLLGVPVYVAILHRCYLTDLKFSIDRHIVQAMQSTFIFTMLIPYEESSCSLSIDYAIANKLTPFISMQNHYSLLYREEEREMMPALKVRLLCA